MWARPRDTRPLSPGLRAVLAATTLAAALSLGGQGLPAATVTAAPSASTSRGHGPRAGAVPAPRRSGAISASQPLRLPSASGGGVQADAVPAPITAGAAAEATGGATATRGATPAAGAAPVAGAGVGAGALDAATQPPAPAVLQSWPGTTVESQSGDFGSANEAVAPPSPSVAVGTLWVVETTDAALYVDTRSGSPYPDRGGATCPAPGPTAPGYTPYSLGGCDAIDLDSFVDANGWQLSDPRVVYDAGAGRFYLSFDLFQTPAAGTSCAPGYPAGATCSLAFIFHTVSGDPTGRWEGDFFSTYYENVVADQPMVGFSSTDVAISWDEDTLAGAWDGDEVLVMSKALFLSGSSRPVILPATGAAGPPEAEHFSLDPVPEVGAGPTLYLVANDASDLTPSPRADLYVVAVTGDTAATAQETSYSLPLSGGLSTAPPDAPQAGTSNLLATDDDRINESSWSDGLLWTGFGESCTPAGDTAARACIRYLEVSTAAMSVDAEITFGLSGEYVYYPSFGVDPQGDLFTTLSVSSASLDPSVMAMGIPAGATALSAPVTVVRGTGPYWYYGSQSPPTLCNPSFGGCRFGDVAGGAVDPEHPGDFWFVDEAQLDATDPGDWGTELGTLTYAAPSISTLTPSVGPSVGGTPVTVSGSDFAPGTTFTLAGAPVTVANLTPYGFTFTTPPGSPGSASGSAADALGASAPAAYLYVAPSQYHPLAPYRVLDTRAGTCVQCGGGALGPGETRTIQVGGYAPPGYAGATVPATATAVVLNVTAVQGTAGTYLTVLPAGSGVPTASNLNPSPGEILPNLVTVALGAGGGVSIHNAAGTIDVVADVEGYYAPQSGAAGDYHALSPPVRVCDTRAEHGTPCSGSTDSPIGAGQSRLVAVSGLGTATADGGHAEAVALNLTAVEPTEGTYLTVYPPIAASGGAPVCAGPPRASTLNLAAGAIQPNRVIASVLTDGGTGYVCVYNAAGSVNVILDVDGWYGDGGDTGGALFYPLGPTRICDTRPGSATECAGETLGSGASLAVAVAGAGPLPASGVTAIAANVTAVQPTEGTYLSVYPDAASRPSTSDLNAAAHEIIANLTMVAVAADGRIDIFNAQGSIDVVVDVVGWFQ